MTDTDLLALADERFVSLTTWRRSGAAVSTPVWVARVGDALVVTTPAGSGKVKRLRHDPRVALRPCDRRGRVAQDPVTAHGLATIVDAPADQERPRAALRAKYRVEYQLVSLVGRLLSRGHADRVILRLTPVD